jgi:hypothetical protein
MGLRFAPAALLAAALPALAANEALVTAAERSKFRQTGRYPEVLQLCAAFEKAFPRDVRCVTFGRTPESRPMVALVVSRAGTLSAEEARRRKLPVVLIQGGIHAGEIDGKDAGFLALREMLEGRAARARSRRPCSCSCRSSTSMATSGSANGIVPTSAAPRRWAGAPRRRTST